MVGNVQGRHFNEKTLKEWVASLWSGSLGYVPTVKLLEWGWFIFKFGKNEDAKKVLNLTWSIDSTPIFFKMWMSLFDARKERLDVVPIWVHLPFLLVDFWSREIFSKIGNTLGSFL